jgi:hypothetical protein
MLISSLLFFAACFVVLLLLLPIGAKLLEYSKGISTILMMILGASSLYAIAFLLNTIFESFEYKWFHFIGLFLLIGAMNNANLKGESTRSAQFASTFLFFGFVIMAICLFWLID